MTTEKISELKLLVLQHKPLVIAVTEMKLHKRKDNRTIKDYKLDNRDRCLYSLLYRTSSGCIEKRKF